MRGPRPDSKIDFDDDGAKARSLHNRALAGELRAKVAAVAPGGNVKSRERHTSRGKLLPREQVERYLRDAKLLDIGAGTNEIRQMLIGRELIGAA
jgi:3-methylcrotonyl-CoA carboxylase beta subunit